MTPWMSSYPRRYGIDIITTFSHIPQNNYPLHAIHNEQIFTHSHEQSLRFFWGGGERSVEQDSDVMAGRTTYPLKTVWG